MDDLETLGETEKKDEELEESDEEETTSPKGKAKKASKFGKVAKAPKVLKKMGKGKDSDEKPENKGNANYILRDTIDSIQSKFGEGAIMMLGDTPKVDIGVIPTGSMGLDAALGVGGYPRGRIVEIYGPESSGKTTLTLHAIAEAQKLGGICAFIDAEHAMDPEYAAKLGVDTHNLLLSLISSPEFRI